MENNRDGMASYTEDAVTYAKLDMSLIRNIHQNPATCTLVTGRIDFCHANGLKEPFLNHLIK